METDIPVFEDFCSAASKLDIRTICKSNTETDKCVESISESCSTLSGSDCVSSIDEDDLLPTPPLVDAKSSAERLLDEFHPRKTIPELALTTESNHIRNVEKKYTEKEVLELLEHQQATLSTQHEAELFRLSRSCVTTPMESFVKVAQMKDLKAHEEILPDRVDQFHEYLMSYGLNNPICMPAIIVDYHTNMIVDGHHRFYTLQKLGLLEVEVLFIDYNHDDVLCQSSHGITKESVREAARLGKLLKPKMSRHLIRRNGKVLPILCASTIISFVLKIVLTQI